MTKSYEKILPNILAFLTRHPRFKQEWEWYEYSWVGNLFTLYHKIFWERCGSNGFGDNIKKSVRTRIFQRNGRWIEEHHFFLWESLFVHLEMQMRKFLSQPHLKIEFQFVPLMQPVGMPSIGYQKPIFSFAIASDNKATGSSVGTNSLSFSHTTAGANRILFANGGEINIVPTITGIDYVSGTHMTAYESLGVTTIASIWDAYIFAPTLGANNVIISASTSQIVGGESTSYTGAKQSGFPDAAGTGSPQTHSTADGTFSGSITTVAANCWTWLVIGKNGGAAPSATSGCAVVSDNTAADSCSTWDSNGSVGAAGTTQTMVVNTGAANKSVGSYFSFAPVAAAATTTAHNFSIMGVGK